MQFPGLIGPSYVLAASKAEVEKSINVYRERVESDQGVNPFCLNKSPGLLPQLLGSLGTGRWRGLSELNDVLFGVLGDHCYSFDAAYNNTNFGVVSNDGKPVQMAASANSLLFVSNGVLYRINAAALTVIVLPFTPLGVVFLKNYFVVLSSSMQQFYWSVDDGATFDALNVQTAEADANNMIAIQTIDQLLCIIGNRITQWFSVGSNPDAPFDPIDSGVMRSGTAAPASVARLGGSLIWLERTQEGQHKVVKTEAFTPVTISNNYVANKIRELARVGVSDAIGMTYTMNNQEFYRLTFPEADYTLEYNKTLNEWQDPLWFDWQQPGGVYHRHRANCMVSAFGKTLVGDHTNGELYELSPSVYHDFGFPMRWNRRSPHVVEENKGIIIPGLKLGIQTGVGLTDPLWLNNYSLDAATFTANLATAVGAATVTAAQAVVLQAIYDFVPYDLTVVLPNEPVMTPLGFYEWGRRPQISLKYSGDGGKSYSSELKRDLGRAGEDPDVVWNRLGRQKDFVVDLFGDDPCQIGITAAYFDPEPEILAY